MELLNVGLKLLLVDLIHPANLNVLTNDSFIYASLFGSPSKEEIALIQYLLNLTETSNIDELRKILLIGPNLSRLRYLYLSYAKITELPDSIGQLINLRYLDLSKTRITELPNSIGLLIKLEWLDLSRTRIKELPDSIGRLIKLEWLYLCRTRIKELPDSSSQLINLQKIYLYGTGIIMDDIPLGLRNKIVL